MQEKGTRQDPKKSSIIYIVYNSNCREYKENSNRAKRNSFGIRVNREYIELFHRNNAWICNVFLDTNLIITLMNIKCGCGKATYFHSIHRFHRNAGKVNQELLKPIQQTIPNDSTLVWMNITNLWVFFLSRYKSYKLLITISLWSWNLDWLKRIVNNVVWSFQLKLTVRFVICNLWFTNYEPLILSVEQCV